MQVLYVKKNNDEIFIKLGAEKEGKKKSTEEKVKKRPPSNSASTIQSDRSDMDSIEIPARYLCPNPLEGQTNADLENAALRYFIDHQIIGIEGGKLQWLKWQKQCYLQIYSVQFITYDKKELDQICGKIILDIFKIFQRKLGGNRYAINKEGFARLIGPTGPLDGWGRIQLYPRMYRANRPDDFFHPKNPEGYTNKFLKEGGDDDSLPESEDEAVYGKYIYDADFNKKPVDQIINEEVGTSVGVMKYSFAILEDSIDSFVTIKLLEWKGEGDGASVYGSILASNTKIEVKYPIFERTKSEALIVKPQQYIPIDRPVNIVSVGHSLELSLRIRHKNETGDSVSLFNGIILVEGGIDGIVRTRQVISEKWGKLEVKVYFLPFWSW